MLSTNIEKKQTYKFISLVGVNKKKINSKNSLLLFNNLKFLPNIILVDTLNRESTKKILFPS